MAGCKGLGAKLILWFGFLLLVLAFWDFCFLNVAGYDT